MLLMYGVVLSFSFALLKLVVGLCQWESSVFFGSSDQEGHSLR